LPDQTRNLSIQGGAGTVLTLPKLPESRGPSRRLSNSSQEALAQKAPSDVVRRRSKQNIQSLLVRLDCLAQCVLVV
jgi:hypothetical protein